jgi:hypothetical protein
VIAEYFLLVIYGIKLISPKEEYSSDIIMYFFLSNILTVPFLIIYKLFASSSSLNIIFPFFKFLFIIKFVILFISSSLK